MFPYFTSNGASIEPDGERGNFWVDPDATMTLSHIIQPVRQADGVYRLNGFRVVYTVLYGAVLSIVPTLTLVKYDTPNTETGIPVTNSGYSITPEVQTIGTSTVDTPVYITPTDGDIYRVDITISNDTGYTHFGVSGVDVLYDIDLS